MSICPENSFELWCGRIWKWDRADPLPLSFSPSSSSSSSSFIPHLSLSLSLSHTHTLSLSLSRWFNTHFINSGYLCFQKQVVDKACKDKKHSNFDADFKVEVYFEQVEGADVDAASISGVAAESASGGAGAADEGVSPAAHGGGSHDSEW